MSSQQARSCELVKKQAQHVVAGEDCSMGYRDPSRNPKVSWVLDMSRIASGRPQYEGSRLDAWPEETGHMWRRP